MPLRRMFLWTMIGSLSLAALLGILTLLLWWRMSDEVLASAALFAAFSLVAMCCAIVIEQHRLRWLMWIGLLASAAALPAWLIFVWFRRPMSSSAEWAVINTGGALTVMGTWCAYYGLIAALPLLHPRAKAVKWTAIASTSIVGLFIFMVCVAQDWMEDCIVEPLGEDLIFRLLGVVGIVAACGTAVALILWKVQRLRQAASAESVPSRLRVRIVCPRCGSEQALPTGPARCARCALHITVKVDEPRCACGCLLHHPEAGRCPQCGRAIPLKMRWKAVVSPE